MIARLIADKLRASLSRPVIVENVVGAGGRLVLENMMRRPANGSVFTLTPSGMLTISPNLYSKLLYNPLRDFIPVSGVCTYSYSLVVGPGTTARSLEEFLGWCKANPSKASYGVPALGAATHFLGWLLSQASGTPLTVVPYKGGPQLTQAVLGGEIASAINLVSNFRGLHASGRLRVLAISQSERSPRLPDVPTFAELGYKDCVVEEFMCFVARIGTPATAVTAVADGVRRALGSKDVRDALLAQEFDPAPVAGATVGDWINSGYARWGNVVKASGFKPED
ncbi:MAG: hypothetical protein A2V78_14345 [Betaproteobacteria bacterium RBG_16_64_18]|nr:MAG: hypothetical protein A2V78_14345 [Betaproteobacteria bacterium RBG_16_64_18]OGA39860.1 MAG: hypothetical protein A3G26_11930 [Betaproteobacteria bacterium RIFCSPLOWO2_12_FULL_65_110]